MNKFNIPVVFEIKAGNEDQAKEFVTRLLRYGFESISEYEPQTWKAVRHWAWAEIRGVK